jgi:hypothetical protein
MAKPQRNTGTRRHAGPAEPSPFEQARDELFQHIMRCGVVGAEPEHVEEWFADTIKYMTERFPELSEQQIGELKTLGLRFAQPPKTRTESDAASAA